IDALVAGSWGIWQGTGQDEVVLRFDAEAAPRVRATLWHPSARYTDRGNGGVELRLRVASEVEMRPWVLGWGAMGGGAGPASVGADPRPSRRRPPPPMDRAATRSQRARGGGDGAAAPGGAAGRQPRARRGRGARR